MVGKAFQWWGALAWELTAASSHLHADEKMHINLRFLKNVLLQWQQEFPLVNDSCRLGGGGGKSGVSRSVKGVVLGQLKA